MVKDIRNAHAIPAHLRAVRGANALARRAQAAAAKLDFLQSVDESVQVEDDMGAVRYEDAVGSVKAVGLQSAELLEEGRDVHHAAGADQVDASWVDQARRQDVEVVGFAVGDDGVACVVSSGSCV